MDKNMINIDDLFAQRLAGGEEKERAGAWANMRELLDKEMPQRKPVAGFNWRRTLTVATGAVLIAALSVGGYEKFSSFRASDNLAKTVSMSGSSATSGEAAGNDMPSGKNNMNNNSGNTAPLVAEDNDSDNSTANNTAVASDNEKNTSAGNASNTGNTASAANNTTASGNEAKRQSGKRLVKSTGGDARITSSGNATIASSKKDVANSKMSVIGTNSAEQKPEVPAANKLAANEKQGTSTVGGADSKLATTGTATINPVPAATANNAVNNKNNTVKPTVADKPAQKDNSGNTASNNNKPADKKASDKAEKDAIARREKMFKDSIKLVETRERFTVTEGWKRDTIQQAKTARYDVVPVDPAKAKSAVNPVPAAGIVVADADAKLEPLESKRVSTRKISNMEIAGSRFEEMVKNAKFNMSRVTFHSGIIGGVNSSVAGANTTMGIQLGMFGVANFGEHWSVWAELKYMQRWGGSNVVTDNYNSNKYETPAPTPGYIQHTWDSVQHSFNYPTLNSVHLPVSVRYALNRFSMFCGADFAYNFAVNAEEVQQERGMKVSQITPLNATGLRYDPEKTRPGITYKDFSSRLDLGVLVGCAYSITPSTMVDLRVVQSVWNDANTAGEIKVFNELYNKPSVQFNISYRFGNNKFRAYRR